MEPSRILGSALFGFPPLHFEPPSPPPVIERFPPPITDLERYACLSNPFYNPSKDGWWAEPPVDVAPLETHYG